MHLSRCLNPFIQLINVTNMEQWLNWTILRPDNILHRRRGELVCNLEQVDQLWHACAQLQQPVELVVRVWVELGDGLAGVEDEWEVLVLVHA